MKQIIAFLLPVCFAAVSYSQVTFTDSLVLLFQQQLASYPQEKIYLHTDKPYYLSGETIWFRAHVADAATHLPGIPSRYVYVELIDPLDSVLSRIKIPPVDGAHYGNVLIPDDVPEGDYRLRAYTNFMRNAGEEYFYMQTVRIGDPQARFSAVDVRFEFPSDKKVNAIFRFSHTNTTSPIVPEKLTVTVNDGRKMYVKPNDDGTASITFNLQSSARQRVMWVETVVEKYPYRQYFTIPAPDDDYEVSFFPEGGQLLMDVMGSIAFKALKSDGSSEDITGNIFDQDDNHIGVFESDISGMGSFSLMSEKGKSYYAVCENAKGHIKRFNLPQALASGCALACVIRRNNLYVSVLKTRDYSSGDSLYLIAHTRGILQYAKPWNMDRDHITIPRNLLASGVQHFILLDARRNPVSERLVFINNEDQAIAGVQPDRENYKERSPVSVQVTLTDPNEKPVAGNFSVSVTDDREVIPDSTSNILTSLLLESDLRGHIGNPAFYFRNDRISVRALDLLMMTHGWRRYDVERIFKGDIAHPAAFLEIGPEISGTVKSVLSGKPAGDIDVTLISPNGNCFETTQTDENGRFYFRSCEMPDSTTYLVHAIPKVKMKRLELVLDKETFPGKIMPKPASGTVNRSAFVKYIDKAERKYIDENGIRVIALSEVVIAGQRKPVQKSVMYNDPDYSFTEERLDEMMVHDIYVLLSMAPGVRVMGKDISIRGSSSPPLLLIDDMPTDISDLDMINVHDIGQIDVLKNIGNTAIFGMRGSGGVIAIFTKEGKFTPASPSFNIKTATPLGIRMPVEFYAPKYDTPAAKRNSKPDLRTTIHWQPSLSTDDSGNAAFDFYTADSETTYTMILEGLTADGKIIRQEQKISRK